jgi:DNA-binding transcriptional LysR family regulator
MHAMQELLKRGGLEELAAFVAVAEAGSFTEAAKKLRRDASVISRRSSQIEQRLGVRLLSRTTRRVALTEVGVLYYRRVQALLDELASASREASDFAASPQGLVRVSLPITFRRQWIAPLLPSFLARHPQIRIDVRFTDRFVDVVAEGFDIAIRVGALRNSSLASRRMASYRNFLVAAPSYLAARGTPQTPADLMNHACLGFTSHAAWPEKMVAFMRSCRPVAWYRQRRAFSLTRSLNPSKRGWGSVMLSERITGGPGSATERFSDQYAPFATRVIPATAHEAPCILDGLLQNDTGRQVKEHCAGTRGFIGRVFAEAAYEHRLKIVFRRIGSRPGSPLSASHGSRQGADGSDHSPKPRSVCRSSYGRPDLRIC